MRHLHHATTYGLSKFEQARAAQLQSLMVPSVRKRAQSRPSPRATGAVEPRQIRTIVLQGGRNIARSKEWPRKGRWERLWRGARSRPRSGTPAGVA